MYSKPYDIILIIYCTLPAVAIIIMIYSLTELKEAGKLLLAVIDLINISVICQQITISYLSMDL